MRIIGGTLRGAKLVAPQGRNTRPTSDRVREAMFNILTHGLDGFALDDARVLDLFAGTGALGFEALSRGAQSCTFIDDNPAARGLIRRNAENLDVMGRCNIFRRDAARLGKAGSAGSCDLVFADPPYAQGLGERALASARQGGWLAEGAICILEERADTELMPISGLTLLDQRRYGDSVLHILQNASLQNTSAQ